MPAYTSTIACPSFAPAATPAPDITLPSRLSPPPPSQILQLSFNQLSGPLPPALLSSLPSLELLDVSNNQLGGQLPAEVSALSSLLVLSLHRWVAGGWPGG